MQPEKAFLRPKMSKRFGARLLVRKSNGQFIDPNGETLVLDTYLRRRINCGDLVAVDETKKTKPVNKPVAKTNTSNKAGAKS